MFLPMLDPKYNLQSWTKLYIW